MRIAIPRMGETVAPCFEYCATMAIFTVAEADASAADASAAGADGPAAGATASAAGADGPAAGVTGAPAILSQVDFPLQSREPFDRVRLLRDQKVDTVICGGMQSFYEDVLRASGFEVISWVSGLVEELLALYLQGALVPGTELPGDCGPDLYSMDRTTEH